MPKNYHLSYRYYLARGPKWQELAFYLVGKGGILITQPFQQPHRTHEKNIFPDRLCRYRHVANERLQQDQRPDACRAHHICVQELPGGVPGDIDHGQGVNLLRLHE